MKRQKLIFSSLLLGLIVVTAYARPFKVVTVTSPGELESCLDDDWEQMDSVVVKGMINKADFRTLYNCALFGNLKVINLEMASVEGNIIPSFALYYPDICFSHLPLERIILPENVMEIGEYAFARMKIRKINLPASLKKLSDGVFKYNQWLEGDPFIVPEGITEIPQACFYGCKSIRKIIFPQSLKTIEAVSFYDTRMEEMNLPEGLDSIGWEAFYGSENLKKVILPETALHLGEYAFGQNFSLTFIRFPQGLKKIPISFLNWCPALDTIDISDGVTIIGSEAFLNCENLSSVRFPKNLKTIESGAFRRNKITEIVFPPTLEFVGKGSFHDSEMLERVYCPAQTPPFAEFDNPDENEGSNHARPFISGKEMTLFVPVGTGDVYRNADGWKAFDHIVEIEEFPSSCGVTFAPECTVNAYAGTILVHNPTATPVDVRVYDSYGKMLRHERVSQTSGIAVEPGIYLVWAADRTYKVAVR